MKAIKINFDGVVRYSTIKEINKYGFCYLSDKASAFIRAQSLDNNVYDGTEPIFPQLGITGKESTSTIFATINGVVCYYYIKGPVYDDNNPFAPAKEGEWEWKRVELSVIDLMDDDK